jgi:GTP-binding protein Era
LFDEWALFRFELAQIGTISIRLEKLQKAGVTAESAFRAGFVCLMGKPNVGKSTLMNQIVGQKVSIVSNKPQTTRRNIRGIAHGEHFQIVFIDTPGVHEPHTRLGKSMVDQARASTSEADAILYVADGSHHPGEMDRQIAEFINASENLKHRCRVT